MITIPYEFHRRSLNALMDEAGRHEVPTIEEERKLIAAAKRGNRSATHRLVLGNLRFVIKLAHNMGRNADLIEELVASGVVGLMESLKAYCQQSSRGGRFVHYAVFHIRRQMRRTLNDYRNPVTTNPNNFDLARKIFAYEETTLKAKGYKPTHIEIGKKFGLTPNRVERTKKLMESPLYLDHTLSSEDERSGHDICADTAALAPSLLTENRMEAELLKSLMNEHLSTREMIVLERRFGIGSGIPQDLRALGAKLKLSRERVRQIETEALKKLRFHLSQVCPLYHDRAHKFGGVPAMLSSDVSAPVAERVEAVEVVKSAKKSAPTIRVVRKVEVRELEECVA